MSNSVSCFKHGIPGIPDRSVLRMKNKYVLNVSHVHSRRISVSNCVSFIVVRVFRITRRQLWNDDLCKFYSSAPFRFTVQPHNDNG